MNTSQLPSFFLRLACTIAWLSIGLVPIAHAAPPQPGQLPLLNKSGPGVSANIVLTLDDSGSMAFKHMPEDKFAGGTFATNNPVNSNTVRWDLADNYQAGVNFIGTIPGNISSANWVLRAMRSPDTNSIYYNPEIRYQPWLMDDGVTRRPNSPVTAAYVDPPLVNARSTTGLLIGTGVKALVVEAGKAFVVGQYVVVSDSALPATNWMIGTITAFNSATGAMTVNVTKTRGTGTIASWVVAQTPAIDLTSIVPTGTFTAGSFLVGKSYTIVTPGTTNFTLIGAANSNAGTVFTATGVGAGTGRASGGTGVVVTAGAFKRGSTYTIVSPGTTNFTNFGAANSNRGTVFTANANAQAGTGTASETASLNGVPPETVTAGQFVIGNSYTILANGTTNFTNIGAGNNNYGTTFIATGIGAAGTGTARPGPLRGWCYANAANVSGTGTTSGQTPAQGCEAATGPFNHDPGVYFRLNMVSGVYAAVDSSGNYTAYSINTLPATTTYTKFANRLDCAGASCTQAEERQNFANWYTYYRTRNLLTRGAMMEAFGPDTAVVTAGNFVVGSSYSIVSPGSTSFTSIGAASNAVGTFFTATGVGSGTGTANKSNYRLGFGRINKGSASVDGVNTRVLESNTATYGGGGVRDYGNARRVNLFKWLEDLPANGGTPLVTAMESVGNYYSRTDASGPWTDNPAVATNIVADNKTCRRSYNIMATDGYWNGANVSLGNVDATAGPTITQTGASYTYSPMNPYSDGTGDTLADVAMYFWNRDLQSAIDNKVPPSGENTSFWQNMTNYTVGLGVRGTLDYTSAVTLKNLKDGVIAWPAATTGATGANVDDLWHAAINSRGKYFSAKDPKELADGIKAVLAGAAGNGSPTAGVATASSVLSADNRKYVPKFEPISWAGEIEAYELSATGQVGTLAWKASDKIIPLQSGEGVTPFTSARRIFTWDAGLGVPAAVPFTWAGMSSANQSALGSVAATYTTDFIEFLWGSHLREGTAQPFRERRNLQTGARFELGDFVNANPVLVQGNLDGQYGGLGLGVVGSSTNPSYDEYLTYKKARTAVLFASANDGMLHAFKDSKSAAATDGQEVFAYVPRAIYPDLYKLTDKTYGTPGLNEHQFFVDGPLREADAYVKAPGASTASWRNYLMGSLGGGGRAVFALDVTDSANLGASTVRWEISSANDADLGHVMAPIKVGVLPNGRWVAIFGNGFSSTNEYATLFVVDIEDAASTNLSTRAAAIKKLNVDNTGGNGLGGVTLIHDASGQISSIYAGDLKGSLWKFDYDAAAVSKFSISGGGLPLFAATTGAGTAQSISASPAVWNHTSGGKIVVFGTGKLFTTADSNDTSDQTMYAVWDKPADALPRPLGRSNMASRSLSLVTAGFYGLTGASVDWSSQRGWLIDFTSVIPGGRVIYPAQVVGFDTVLISTVAPVQGTPGVCDASGGNGANFLLPVQSGLNPANHNFDTNGDNKADSSDVIAVGYATKADGIDAVVRTTGTNGKDGLGDTGGGGGEGDCTGATCSSTDNPCVPSPLCPEPNTCLASVQSATTGLAVCIDTGTPTTPVVNTRTYDRVWRRIINPPIK